MLTAIIENSHQVLWEYIRESNRLRLELDQVNDIILGYDGYKCYFTRPRNSSGVPGRRTCMYNELGLKEPKIPQEWWMAGWNVHGKGTKGRWPVQAVKGPTCHTKKQGFYPISTWTNRRLFLLITLTSDYRSKTLSSGNLENREKQ